ncbi:MAG: hypothetical protein ABL860_10065 [Candidatus Nitrotoga sp.]
MRRFQEDRDLAINLRDLRLINSFESSVQKVELYAHKSVGKILVINDELQHVEKWQALYHEPLVHLPSAFIPEVREVLILGGGSLYAASEVLRYPTVTRCTLVDHDPRVIDLMVRFYPHAQKVTEDCRFQYVEADALEFLAATRQRFDLVINDCLDAGEASVTTGTSVYKTMTGCLSDAGACSDLVYRHIFECCSTHNARKALRKAKCALSLVFVPEYPGTLHILMCWGDHVGQTLKATRNECQQAWIKKPKSGPVLQFYNPAFLAFHLFIPPTVKGIWNSAT